MLPHFARQPPFPISRMGDRVVVVENVECLNVHGYRRAQPVEMFCRLKIKGEDILVAKAIGPGSLS